MGGMWIFLQSILIKRHFRPESHIRKLGTMWYIAENNEIRHNINPKVKVTGSTNPIMLKKLCKI